MKKKLWALVLGILLSMQIVGFGYCDNISGDISTKTNIQLEQNYLYPCKLVAEKVGPSVVMIQIDGSFCHFLKYPSSIGSGVIFREDGYILTNNHVVEYALAYKTNNVKNSIWSKFEINVVLPSEKEEVYAARVVARDPEKDLAILKIEKTDLIPIEFGNSDELRIGEIAIAVGCPVRKELMGTVTQGVISGLDRDLGKSKNLIQIDTAISPGNSGGALVNSKGQLVGITEGGIVGFGCEGLNFAIPSNKAKEMAMNAYLKDIGEQPAD